jgi:sporulation protein YlmC with PRC-barrel domain
MMIYLMMAEDEELKEKKLRGSGGYVIARISDNEQKKGNLGGPELFIAGIGRLPKDRILKYYCNKCEKDYPTSPDLNYENPNEDVGEGVVLIEKGEYKCSVCNAVISQYRKFDNETPPSSPSKTNSFSTIKKSSDVSKSVKDISDSSPKNKSESEKSILPSNTFEENTSDSIQSESIDTKSNSNISIAKGKYFPIQSIIGMPVYDHEAMLVGNVQEIGLRKSLNGTIQITLKIDNRDKTSETNGDELYNEITWSNISKIGDIVLISREQKKIPLPPPSNTSPIDKKMCTTCQYLNESDALYCEQCGKKLE